MEQPHTRIVSFPVIEDGGRVVAESGAIVDYVLCHHGNGRVQPAPSIARYDDSVRAIGPSRGG
jgi:glutathione S-transferase